MTKKTRISPPVAAAMRRGGQFLRVPTENPGQRVFHHLSLASSIQTAMEHAILAGQDRIAIKLLDLHGAADAAFGAEVIGAEAAWLDAEMAECERQLATLRDRNRRRKLKPQGSPGGRARARGRKRGAIVAVI